MNRISKQSININ